MRQALSWAKVGTTSMSKTDKISALKEFAFSWGKTE